MGAGCAGMTTKDGSMYVTNHKVCSVCHRPEK
jgi:hypothetical protein